MFGYFLELSYVFVDAAWSDVVDGGVCMSAADSFGVLCRHM